MTGWLRKLALSRRQIQVALGVLWLVDGFLKFQPGLRHAGFVQTVITPGVAGGLVVWCGLWLLGAVLWLLPHNRAGGSVARQLTSMAAGEHSWYARLLRALGHDAATSGLWLATLFTAVSLVIAAGPLPTRRPEMFILAGLAVAPLYWVTGEVFGQLLTLTATDPSNGPPPVLLGLGLLPTVPAASPAISPAAQLFRDHQRLAGAGACAAVLLPAAVALTPAASPAAAAPAAPPSTGRQEEGMNGGKPLAAGPNLNTATRPVLRLRLVAERTRFDISGKKVWGESYDGNYVGPTLHFVPGEQVYLTLVNYLPTATNLHFHGLHVSPSGNSDNPYISVPPGRSFTYHLAIPLDQPEGTFWYHDHDMCMGDEGMAMPGMPAPTTPAHCQDIETQIYQGLSGTIIVGDDRTLLPPDLRGITAQTLAFKDMQISPDGHIVANTGSYAISSDSPTVRLVNGQLRPVLTMRPGQTELWRFVNEGADIFCNLHLPGYRFTLIGQDGYPAAKVTTASTLMLPPAKRWDVLVTASAHPGTAWLSTLPINNGPRGDSYPGVRLMELRVAGQPEHPLPMSAGALPGSLPSLASTPIARHRTVTLTENAAGTEMYINGQQFKPGKSIFPTPAILGTTEQWTVRNVSGEVHVFHIHTDHFQVMSINGAPQPYIGEQDIVDVPYEKHRVPGVVVIRIHFTDFTGRIMFHCHIASHEDAGMMSFINVVSPPRPSSRR